MLRRLIIILKLASQNLLSSKLRTFLTVLGVIIGIAAVMIVMSIGSSAQALILDQVRGIGSNIVAILPGASEEDGPPASVFGIVTTTLKNDDLEAVQNQRNVPHIQDACGYVLGNVTVKYENKSFPASYQGVSSSYLEVETAEIEKGRFFTKEEDGKVSRIIVLGYTRAQDLFGDENPLGKSVKLGDLKFRVVGVMAERGSVSFSNPDKDIFVPLLTAQKQLSGIDYLTAIRASVDEEENIPSVIADIQELLRDRHDIKTGDPDDFSVKNAATALDTLTNVTNALKYFLVTVAAIALIVGGIGIMNIMLISLKQRIREIGLRKALGALNRDLVIQFIVESVFISFVGSFIGIVLGIVVTYGAAIMIQSMDYNWPFILTFDSVLIAFVISVVLGILFGIYPAQKAAKVSPTEALRYE